MVVSISSASTSRFGWRQWDQFRAGIARAIAVGWLWRHESGTYVRFTDSGAALFA